MQAGIRRSILYVPGDSGKMIEKSATVPADMLLLNLEDGVALSKKEEARANVLNALHSLDFGDREVVVRVNTLHSEIGRVDLAAVAPCRPPGICLPKIERADEIHSVEEVLLELEVRHGMAEGSIRLHAMIESAAGVIRAAEIACASKRMASLIFGSADYIKDLRCQPGEDRAELLFALQMIVTSARSAGIDAVDAPCFSLRDPGLLRREAEQARRLGFDGKSALHPDQLPIIHEVFAVKPEQIAWAEKVLAELDRAERRGKALATLDGQLIDNPHRVAAERILRRSRT
jgi:citrate lyase subunit beta/citryl-CoA lyase